MWSAVFDIPQPFSGVSGQWTWLHNEFISIHSFIYLLQVGGTIKKNKYN